MICIYRQVKGVILDYIRAIIQNARCVLGKEKLRGLGCAVGKPFPWCLDFGVDGGTLQSRQQKLCFFAQNCHFVLIADGVRPSARSARATNQTNLKKLRRDRLGGGDGGEMLRGGALKLYKMRVLRNACACAKPRILYSTGQAIERAVR